MFRRIAPRGPSPPLQDMEVDPLTPESSDSGRPSPSPAMPVPVPVPGSNLDHIASQRAHMGHSISPHQQQMRRDLLPPLMVPKHRDANSLSSSASSASRSTGAASTQAYGSYNPPPEIGAEYVPGTVVGSMDMAASAASSGLPSPASDDDNDDLHTISSQRPVPLPSRSQSDVVPRSMSPGDSMLSAGLNQTRHLSLRAADSSDQYLPDEQAFAAHPLANVLSSPTLGLSEADWRRIPFSSRRKLVNALETGSPLSAVPQKDLPDSLVRVLESAPVSLAGSVVGSRAGSVTSSMGDSEPSANASPMGTPLSPRQTLRPFSRRMKERSATMYPALRHINEGIPATGFLGPQFIGNTTSSSATNLRPLSRSTSLSNHSSDTSDSPAYRFLAKFGNSDGTNTSFEADIDEQVGDYVLGKMIAYGGFSQVREAHAYDDVRRQPVVRAVKIVKKIYAGETPERLERVQNEFDHEVTLWKTLDHPHVLRLLQVEQTPKATYCFTDKITGGTLFDFVRSTRTGKTRNPQLLKDYSFQLVTALLYLHESKFIVHRDVKLENCLLEQIGEDRFKVLLCDFGLSDYYEYDAQLSEGRPLRALSRESSQLTFAADGSIDRNMTPPVIGPSETSSILNQHRERPYKSRSDLASSRRSSASGNGDTITSRVVNTPPLVANGSRANSSNKLNGPELLSPAATQSFNSTTENCGSMPYASPQLLQSKVPIFDPSVDMWAYGVVVYALHRNRLPWSHGFPPKLTQMILEGDWDEADFAAHAGPDITHIVKRCLEKDVSSRASVREIVHLPCFKELRALHADALR